ncbi:MAG: hypothetical protein RL172_905 [Bacteroidota bacterium]|jgi:uncharacterized protein YndB with AHSA1/START domain
MAAPYTWSHFVTRIAVNAPAEKLYRLWATRAGIEYWFLRMGEFTSPDGSLRAAGELVQKNDVYRWRWHGWSDEVTEEGAILQCNGSNQLQFSFGKAGNCTVSIKEELGYTMVELIQENIPDDELGKHYWHLGCKTGWTFYLANLKSLCEGGIDLRNKDERLQNVVNA